MGYARLHCTVAYILSERNSLGTMARVFNKMLTRFGNPHHAIVQLLQTHEAGVQGD